MKIKQYNSKLVETTLGDAAKAAAEDAKKVLDNPTVISNSGDIENALDEALEDALYEQKTGGKDYPNVLFEGAAGTGKAQPLTSKIYTPTGYITMKNAQVGDKVLDGAGNETIITEIFPQDKQHPIYKINFSDGTNIEVADNHLNSVFRVTSKGRITKNWIREDLVLTTDKLIEYTSCENYKKTLPTLHVDTPIVKAWKSSNLPIDPYALGLLIGSGSLHNGIGFTTKDSELISYLTTYLKESFGLSRKDASDNINYIFTDTNDAVKKHSKASAFSKLLAKLGLNTTPEFKHIPDMYKYASFEDRLALIQGLMDTDGTIDKKIISKFLRKEKGGEASFCSTSIELINDVAFVLRSLGCNATVKACSAKTCEYRYKDVEEPRLCKQAYTIYINYPSNIMLFRLQRKLDRVVNPRFEPRRTIESVTFDRFDDCKCIMVESELHTYLTDNLTVTHNTSRIIAWARKNNINLLKKLGSTMDDTDLGGAVSPDADHLHAVKLGTTEFDILGTEPRTVLYLDEYNRAPRSVRGTLLTLIQDHVIPDAREKTGERFLPNFLFTIASINPSNSNYNTDELDDAELSRFRRVKVGASSEVLKKYLIAELERQYAVLAADKDADPEYLAKRKLILDRQTSLARTILEDRTFRLDNEKNIDDSKENGNGLILTYRTFMAVLKKSNGTKEDFLDKWNDYCNSTRKKEIEVILKNYKDVENKANDILKKGTESKVFGKHMESDYEKLSNLADKMSD